MLLFEEVFQVDREVLPLVEVETLVAIEAYGLLMYQSADTAQTVALIDIVVLEECHNVVGVYFDNLDIYSSKVYRAKG